MSQGKKGTLDFLRLDWWYVKYVEGRKLSEFVILSGMADDYVTFIGHWDKVF